MNIPHEIKLRPVDARDEKDLIRSNDIHLVIRSVKERTFPITKLLALEALPDERVTVIEQHPFEDALRATYHCGISAGRKWTMTLDADVLLRPGGISELLREAERLPLHYGQVQGRVFDKITGLCRHAGNRIYRTEMLPVALELIPERGTEIRPETFVLRKMRDAGYPSRSVKVLVGLHDFEQSYRDLYRKAMIQSQKMLSLHLGDIIQRCVEQRDDDPDFLVVLKGICDGLQHRGNFSIDSRLFVDIAAQALEELGLEEKPALENAEFVKQFQSYYHNVTAQIVAAGSHSFGQPASTQKTSKSTLVEKIGSRIRERGMLMGLIASLGGLLRRYGRILEQ